MVNVDGMRDSSATPLLKKKKQEAEMNKYKEEIKQLKMKGNKYYDKDFPPKQQSLISDWNDKSATIRDIVDDWKVILWIRADQIPTFNTGDTNDKLEIFKDGITPMDILQGKLADGYLLSAFAAIAEFPGAIEKMFETNTNPKEGIFGVWVYTNGERQQVLVDNYFPCKSQKPVFSRANGKELWVMILEKVYAKINKSYANII